MPNSNISTSDGELTCSASDCTSAKVWDRLNVSMFTSNTGVLVVTRPSALLCMTACGVNVPCGNEETFCAYLQQLLLQFET